MAAALLQPAERRLRRALGIALLVAAPAGWSQSLLEPLPGSPAAQAPSTTTTPGASAADPAGESQRLSQLFYQLQVLQQEVQELRGLVEEQSYQLSRLQRDQQEQYIDLDRRLAEVVTGRAGSAATVPAGAGSTGLGASTQSPRGVPGSTAGQTLASGGRSAGTERDAYTRAFELMKAREFDASAAAFNQLIVEYPNGQYTPNAFYWLGELYLAQTQTEQARQSFAQVLNLYPEHPKVPDTLYKMGVVYHRLGDNDRAIRYFQQVQTEHPTSSAAGLAARYVAELK